MKKLIFLTMIFLSTFWFFNILGGGNYANFYLAHAQPQNNTDNSNTNLTHYINYILNLKDKEVPPSSFQNALKPGAVEILSKRSWNQKVFTNPDGSEQYIVSSSSLHYNDGDGWQDINTTVQPTNDGFEMMHSIYKAQFNKNFQSNQIVKIQKDGFGISVSPGELSWTNTNGDKETISDPEQSIGSSSGNIVSYLNAYGNGLDFTYETNDTNLIKKLIVPNLESLPIPNQNILKGENPSLSLNLGFELDKEMDIYVNGALLSGTETNIEGANIEFKDDNRTVWRFAPPKAWDSTSPVIASEAKQSIVDGTLSLSGNSKKLNLTISFPYSWLKTAQYPVTIDPDTYYGETTDGIIYGHDSTYAPAQITSSDIDATGVMWVGQSYQAGLGVWTYQVGRSYLEFNTSGIDDAATVVQANLYMTVETDMNDTNFVVRVHEYTWTSPLASATQETDYDGALAATANAVTWKNTADVGFAVNTPYASEPLRTAYIEKGATKTKFALVSDRDVAATEPTTHEDMFLYSQDAATPSYRPYLSIVTSNKADVLLTGTVTEYLALTFGSGSTISFGNISPTTPKCGDVNTQADVITNAANGYTLGLQDSSDTNSSMLHTDAATYVPDMSSGGAVVPLSAPIVWGSLFGVGVTMFSGTQKEVKWGTGTTVCDTAYDKYGAVPAATTPHHTVTGFHAASDASYWDWRINVENTQKTGQYDGNVLFTSTAVLT